MKKLSKWVPHELNTNQKIVWIVIFSYTMQQQWTISQLDCDAWQSRFYMTNDDDHLSAWTKKKLQSTSQSQTCTKTRSWSLFGDPLPIWSTTAFWILVKPLYLRSMLNRSNEMHQKRQCLQLALVNRMDPILLHNNAWPHVKQPMLPKVNKLG